MSWPVPTAAVGPWNPMAVTPDMSAMGNYPAGQWAAMQQQNWQQWAQWQQQYAQWQSQYGDKYAQQMQMQMGGMPPLPLGGAPAPAPPPPEQQPPPPPPHENNQPLYASGDAPGPVPPPDAKRHNTPYSNQTPGNQNWSPATSEAAPPVDSGQSVVNAEALKKLAEEERLFDIQFQKWEEEIEKWKQENVNHPDKEAYKEYEAKFESCRAQLLERRQQMKLKRARLTGGAAPPPPLPTAAHPSGVKKPAPPANPPPTSNYNNQKMPPLQMNKQTPNYPNQSNEENQQYHNTNNKSMPQQSRQNSNKNFERVESYQNMDDYSTSGTGKSSFLPVGDSSKGIPGLDLVPEAEKPQREVIDITDDYPDKQSPDYSKISKGINNILGDEKIMNILSMVRDTIVPEADKTSNPGGLMGMGGPPTGVPPPSGMGSQPFSGMGGPGGNFGMPGGNYGGYGGNYSGPAGNFSGSGPMYGGSGGNYGGPGGDFGGPGSNYGSDSSMPQNNQWNQYNNQQQYDNQPNNGFYYNSQGPPSLLQNPPSLLQNPPPLLQNPPMTNSMQDNNQGGMPQNQYYERNNQFSGPRGGPQPLMATPLQPPMQDMAGQRNIQDPNRGYNNNSGVHENNVPMNQPQPPKPKWVEEPLFTPSIVVDYEHKPLRLKAREFIEPVHMFDYNHISKDEENKKKDFEKEAEDLFTRKPRRLDDDRDKIERFSRDIPRDFDYARRPREDIRDDHRQRVPPRDEYDDRRMPRESLMERRPPREEFIERRPPRDEFIERRPPRDEFIERRSSRDEFIERRAPRDEFIERRAPRDEFIERRPPRDEFIERRPPRDEFIERRPPRDDLDDRRPARDEIEDRRRLDSAYFERRRDDRGERSSRREEIVRNREKYRSDHRREEKPRSKSREICPSRDSLKREHSKESEDTDSSKRLKDSDQKFPEPKHVVMIDDLLELPGREMRPEKIVVILRGPPGSGKSYVAKLIRDREAEHGGSVRIMSVDDYFMLEGEVEEKDPATGKVIKKPTLKYEYDSNLEEAYLTSLKRAFKRSLTDGYYSFLIFDAVNDQLRSYADMWNFARQNGFQVYICTMELDPQTCFKRNIHNRTLEDIQVICSRFYPTPAHHIQLDATTLLQSAAITDVQMEDATDDDVICEDAQDEELMPKGAAPSQVENSFTSKWEKMDDVAQLARLDGTSKPLRPSQISMEDYLQLDEWKPNESKPGKKTVRWADIEERREQEKMRAIGFVVGQTDWNRMTDPTMGSSALTKTKYIERVRRD